MKLFTKLWFTLLCVLMAGVTSVYADDEVALTADMFYTWNGVDADAVSTGAASVDFQLGVELEQGNVVCGTSSVFYNVYADLTGYTKVLIEGSNGTPLRFLFNRPLPEEGGDPNGGKNLELNPTIGDDGKLEIDLTSYQFVHLNAIKINWGGSGTVTSIKLVKPSDPLAIPKENLKKTIDKAKLQSAIAKTAESWATLTSVLSDAEAALADAGATELSLTTATQNLNDAIAGLTLAEGYYNLTKEMYKHWNDNYNPTESSEFNGAYVVGESTGQPYGDGSVHYLNFADISAYDKLILTVVAGTPRIMMNRLEVGNGGGDSNGGGYVQLTDAPVDGVVEVDLTAYEYAHLNAIKGANYGSVTITGMYLYKAPAPVLNTYTATFTTNRGWENVYAYAWTTVGEGEGAQTTEFLGTWPGTELTATDGVYTVSIKADAAPANIIFNNGQGGEGNQTADLDFENGKAYDFNVAVEDVLPIDIQFGADYNEKGVGGYTYTWTATKNNKTWTLFGFNNNSSNWAYVKCGQQKVEQTATIASPAINAAVKYYVITVDATKNVSSATLTIKNGDEIVGDVIDITTKFTKGEVIIPVEGQKGYSYLLTINSSAGTNGSTQISKITLAAEVQEPVHIANTAETAYTVAEAIALIDAGEALSDSVYVKGIVSRVDDDAFNSKYNSVTYWISADGTTDGQQFECYSGKGLEGADFASKDDVAVGASVIVKGVMKKYGETYEFDKNNYLVSYEAPVVLNTYTATFTTNQNWEKVYAYVWSGEGENKLLGDWPGTELTANEGVYTVTIQAAEAPEKIIFNSGAGAQTEDLVFVNGQAYAYNVEDSELMAQAKTLAADADAVAVGKLTAAITAAQSTGDDSNLQAAIDQFKADNAESGIDFTEKVGKTTDKWVNAQNCPAGEFKIYNGNGVDLVQVFGVTGEGNVLTQEVEVENGLYNIGLYATSHNAWNGQYGTNAAGKPTLQEDADDVAYVFGTSGENTVKTWITARRNSGLVESEPVLYAVNGVEVTNGKLTMGLALAQAAKTEWHSIQIASLKKITTAKAAYAAVKANMIAEIAAAEALKNDYRIAGLDDFNAAIETAEATLTSNMLNVTEFEAEVATLKAAEAAFRAANYVAINGTFYVQNVATGKFMAAGHSYGTRGIVNATGLDLTLKANENNTVDFDSRVSNGGNSHFLGKNLYMDSDSWGWIIEKAGEDVYTISNGTQFISVDDNDNLVLQDAAATWKFLAAVDVDSERMTAGLAALEAATAENGVDATFLIKANNFNRNDARNAEAWTVSDDCTNKNLGGGCSSTEGNGCAESFHSTFTIMQTISGAPAGKYTLTAQGFYRQDEYKGDAPAAPQFFANGVNGDVPVKSGEEGGMADASVSFTNGLYTIEPIEFEVKDDGMMYVGITASTNTQWVIWDNFQLTYYGAIPVPATHTWDFTQWSEATVTNLKAEAAKVEIEDMGEGKTNLVSDNGALWSDHEKTAQTDPKKYNTTYAASKDNCFWATIPEGGELTANEVAIEELKGLAFNATYSTARSLAIAVNYPETSLGTYNGPAYLWLGGGGKNVDCFVIKNVKVGTAIKMGVESHKTSDARGVQLFIEGAEGARGDMLKDAEGNEVAVPKTYTEQEWAVPATAGEGVCNVIVYNTSGCHIYFIDAEIGEPEPVFATIETVEMRGATDENWQNTVNVTMTKSEDAANVYTGTLDLSKATTDYEFKLVVNNDNWLGFNQLTLDAPEGLVVAKDGDNNNFVLKHATSDYATYNIVATWVPNVSATANWTLKISNGIVTGINTLKTAIENGAVYNLNGQKVMKAQKGLYIINGKKVVKK